MQVRIALLTVTDTRTINTDKSGSILVKKIGEQQHKLVDRKIVKDDKKKINISKIDKLHLPKKPFFFYVMNFLTRFL